MGNIIMLGAEKRVICSAENEQAVENCLHHFDADFGLTRCILKNVSEQSLRFANELFGGSACYRVTSLQDGLLVSYVV